MAVSSGLRWRLQSASGGDYLRPVQVESEIRLSLRLSVEFSLQSPDSFRCFQVHHQSPHLIRFENIPEVRGLPSTGITRSQRYYYPVRIPRRPVPHSTVEAATLAQHGPPPLARSPVSTCRAHYPGGPVQVHPSAASLDRAAFPVSLAGRRPRLPFRGLLRLHTRYGPSIRSTARAAFVAGLRPSQLPNQASCQLPGQPTIARVGLAPTR